MDRQERVGIRMDGAGSTIVVEGEAAKVHLDSPFHGKPLQPQKKEG